MTPPLLPPSMSMLPASGFGALAAQIPPELPSTPQAMPMSPVATPSATQITPPPPNRLEQILRLAAPAALGLLSGLRGGPAGATGFLAGLGQARDQQERRALQEREIAAEESLRETQRLNAERQLETVKLQQGRLLENARLKQRQQFYEMARSLASPTVLARLPRESQLRIVDQLAQGAAAIGEDGDALRNVYAPLITSAEEERRQAALAVRDGVENYLTDNRDKVKDPEFLNKTYPTTLGPMTLTELIQLMPDVIPDPLQPILRPITETTRDAEGNETSVTRVVDLRGKAPGTILGRSSKAKVKPKDPKGSWIKIGGDDPFTTGDDYLFNPVTGESKKPTPPAGLPAAEEEPDPVVTPQLLDLLRRNRGR